MSHSKVILLIILFRVYRIFVRDFIQRHSIVVQIFNGLTCIQFCERKVLHSISTESIWIFSQRQCEFWVRESPKNIKYYLNCFQYCVFKCLKNKSDLFGERKHKIKMNNKAKVELLTLFVFQRKPKSYGYLNHSSTYYF